MSGEDRGGGQYGGGVSDNGRRVGDGPDGNWDAPEDGLGLSDRHRLPDDSHLSGGDGDFVHDGGWEDAGGGDAQSGQDDSLN